MNFVRLASAVIGVLALASIGADKGPEKATATKRLVLTPAEEKAVTTCLNIIRGCQLPDGSFVQVNHERNSGMPVWIAPYFANSAALALLAGHEHKKNPADLKRVGRWLDWCANHQEGDGYWNDFTGPADGYQNNGKVDAWDSSAAMFLLTVGRYQRAGGKMPPALTAAAKKALKCIETVTDKDGLTWAMPTYKVKFLMDNIEVYAGLRAGADFFTAAGLEDEAQRANDQADLIAKKLPDYWMAADKLFAYALHENGAFEGGLKQAYPHGLAQLFGVAFVAKKTDAWTAAKKFSVDEGPSAAAGTERWLVAASRLGGKDAKAWRAKTVKEVAIFTSDDVYIYRPGIAALGLLEGADWMPSPAGGK